MRRWIQRLWSCRAELDEAAFALPVLMLVSLGLVNLALLGYAAINAGNAANYGARMGSMAQIAPATAAYNGALGKLTTVKVGDYFVSVTGGGQPGSTITVTVTYQVPNYFGGIARLFGATTPSVKFQGRANAVFRQEGW